MQTPDERARALVAAREQNARAIETEIAAWQQEIGPTPSSSEIAISPLNVPLVVGDDVEARRRAPNGIIYPHNAIDVFAQTSLPSRDVGVVATVSGRVLFVGEWDAASGHTVFIGGRDGRIYSFAHLASSTVQVGQSVAQGDTIGVYGRSGNARHHEDGNLHYTVRAPILSSASALADTATIASVPSSSAPVNDARTLTSLADFVKIWPTINGVEARTGMVFQPGIPTPPQKNATMEAPLAAPTPPVVAPPATVTGGEACEEQAGPGPCPAVTGFASHGRLR